MKQLGITLICTVVYVLGIFAHNFNYDPGVAMVAAGLCYVAGLIAKAN